MSGILFSSIVLFPNGLSASEILSICKPFVSELHESTASIINLLGPPGKYDIVHVQVCPHGGSCRAILTVYDNAVIGFGWLPNGNLKIVTNSRDKVIHSRLFKASGKYYNIIVQDSFTGTQGVKSSDAQEGPATLDEMASLFPEGVKTFGLTRVSCRNPRMVVVPAFRN